MYYMIFDTRNEPVKRKLYLETDLARALAQFSGDPVAKTVDFVPMGNIGDHFGVVLQHYGDGSFICGERHTMKASCDPMGIPRVYQSHFAAHSGLIQIGNYDHDDFQLFAIVPEPRARLIATDKQQTLNAMSDDSYYTKGGKEKYERNVVEPIKKELIEWAK